MTKRIAFQGEIGAYSEQAAIQFFGENIELVPCATFTALFKSIFEDRADFAVAPIENSLAGSIHENYDLLLRFKAQIVGETILRISHTLLAASDVNIGDIQKVYSHPQALSQCRDFLEKLDVETVPTYDTAGSAKRIAQTRKSGVAAIASERAAIEYNLTILEKNIESNHENFTRFLVIKNPECTALGVETEPNAPQKSSIVFATRDIPGALFKSLAIFALRDINLLKIESRPLHGKPFQYIFTLDFEGDRRDDAIQNALRHLEEITEFVQYLGSYPSANF